MNEIELLLLLLSVAVFFSLVLVLAKQHGFMKWIDWSWLLAFVATILVIGFFALCLASVGK